MRLTRYLRADLVLTDLAAEDAGEVLATLSSHLEETLDDLDGREIRTRLLEREQTHTTSMGHGVAVPHATVSGLEATVLLVARAERPVQYGPAGTDPVRFFFVLLSPPNRQREHIKLLARICRLVRHPGFMEELRAAGDAGELLEAIQRVDQEHV